MFSMPEHQLEQDPTTTEPTAADLAAIDEEWPQIAADIAALDAHIRRLSSAGRIDDLHLRRARRASRRTLRAATVRRVRNGGEAA